MRNEDHWSAAEHDAMYKTPNGEKLSSSRWPFSTKPSFLMNMFNCKELCPHEHGQLHSTSNGQSEHWRTRVNFRIFSSRQRCSCKITQKPGQQFLLLTSYFNPLPVDSWQVAHEWHHGSRISWFAWREFWFIPTWNTIRHTGHAKWGSLIRGGAWCYLKDTKGKKRERGTVRAPFFLKFTVCCWC